MTTDAAKSRLQSRLEESPNIRTRVCFLIAMVGVAMVFTPTIAHAQDSDSVESTGTGPHTVVYEVVDGLPSHVDYRPENIASVGEGELSLYLFGNGACSADGTSSKNHLIEIASHGFIAIAPGGILVEDGGEGEEGNREGGLRAGTPAEALNEALDWALDRKSTRMNSSHVAMSYAGFC